MLEARGSVAPFADVDPSGLIDEFEKLFRAIPSGYRIAMVRAAPT
jgi:hypothetical protein